MGRSAPIPGSTISQTYLCSVLFVVPNCWHKLSELSYFFKNKRHHIMCFGFVPFLKLHNSQSAATTTADAPNDDQKIWSITTISLPNGIEMFNKFAATVWKWLSFSFFICICFDYLLIQSMYTSNHIKEQTKSNSNKSKYQRWR